MKKLLYLIVMLNLLASCSHKLANCYTSDAVGSDKELLLDQSKNRFEYYIKTPMLDDTLRGFYRLSKRNLNLFPDTNLIEFVDNSNNEIGLHVRGLSNGKPISGAIIQIANQADRFTNSDGYISLSMEGKKDIVFEVYATGYSSFKTTFSKGIWIIKLASDFRYNENILKWNIQKHKLKSGKFLLLRQCLE